MDLRNRIHPFTDDPAYSKAIQALEHFRRIEACRLPGSAVSFFIQRLCGENAPQMLVLTASCQDGEIISEDLSSLGIPNTVLPAPELHTNRNAQANQRTITTFCSGLSRLCAGHPFVLICPVPAAVWKGLPEVRAHELHIRTDSEIHIEDLRKELTARNFQEQEEADSPGEFAVRGGIVDIFSRAQSKPVRLEFFGNTVESIRYFDPQSQRSISRISEFSLFDMEITDDTSPVGLLNLIPEQTLILFTDAPAAGKTADNLHGPDIVPWQTVLDQTRKFRTILFQPAMFFTPPESGHSFSICEPERPTDNLTDFLEESVRRYPHRMIYLCTVNQWERDVLETTVCGLDDPAPDRIRIIDLDISSGFTSTFRQLTVLSDKELFKKKKTSSYPASGPTSQIQTFFQVKKGDYVVHSRHGIGKCLGIRTLHKNGKHEDHLCLEYDKGTKLYIPSLNIGMVRKYVGSEEHPPDLDKIGGKSWKKKTEKIKKEVGKIAYDLVRIQAQRIENGGFEFSKDTLEHQKFASLFPFQETPDQIEAIHRLTEDMEEPLAMDRIICGDVGFGKTEVAARGAFKAVMDGKQVAVVSPTTVLTEQHYRTFCDRFREFPVLVERISRFIKGKKQKELLDRLAQGSIDIIIGTHRLLQKDVVFRDLGLLVVDEEHRFGVKDKERIKKMRANVDVLSLTATPIPRTLHLSLSGVKSISVLSTPPMNRLPIETHVERFDEGVIRKAILREKNRQGQIYMVHNRIESIRQFAEKIKKTVPELTFSILHGQMKESELSRNMEDFLLGKMDALITTSIIESGLDIPNVNTLIVDRADRFGLAQLHQLRGRIGRSDRQAYAYLLLPEDRPLAAKARKRLEAIESNSGLGVGFSLAMRDMEIRGAGNLLGDEQHGKIADVGYELYTRMLTEAIENQKGIEPEDEYETDIKTREPCFLPNDYIRSQTHKFQLYNRLYDARTIQDVDDASEDIRDRFGRIPQEVKNLIDIVKIRIFSRHLKIPSIEIKENGELIMNISEMEPGPIAMMVAPLRGYRFTNTRRMIMQLKKKPSRLHQVCAILTNALERIAQQTAAPSS